MLELPSIVVITGIQGACKSTIGRMLAGRFARGAFVEADALQRMIVSGGQWVTKSGGPAGMTDEAADQLRLRLRNSCLVADRSSRPSLLQCWTISSSASGGITSAKT